MAKNIVVINPDALTAKLRALGDIASESTLRQAAVAGAREVLYEAKLRAPVYAQAFEGNASGVNWTRYGVQYYPGYLRDHLIIAYDKQVSVAGRIASYIVTWTREAFYGRFVEHGTSKMAAKPFLRPAYEAKKADVKNAIDDVIAAKIKEIGS
ncbi:HK97-gp10 family putative phage morphogenesis protein [Burkholderia pseudomallei]|uniref:HK97-gp10 family putative phage morphogenesis protein n=1 Tax=Burkholderia pseudomallei TaxID=28450 RepID=UPI002AB4C12E|nr:HK97-gp10 family putative phage morphogenesis protein [Burkholderia pseudomallei]MDY7815371.1 HK97-gp10 family putative phage morphogenesis protein [Burkholderia pseudomallei]MDY7862068.1 HK97-gp10 family putative phage morphogenesis protein [Burkholderia pseudomallei]